MTCAPARYPVHLIGVVPALRVVIRPMLPQDGELQRDFFRSLSAASRYARFLSVVKNEPAALIERLTAVDHVRHLVLLAVVMEHDWEVMIGEARYVVDANDMATCEFAIAIADAWQARGIGRALLDRLQRQAAASGIRCIVAETLAGNRGMTALARSAGFAVRSSPDDARLAVLEKCLAAERPVPARAPSE